MTELPTTIHIDDLLNSPKETLLPVIRGIPEWEDACRDHVGVQQLSGAMTNLVYKVEWSPPDVVRAARVL